MMELELTPPIDLWRRLYDDAPPRIFVLNSGLDMFPTSTSSRKRDAATENYVPSFTVLVKLSLLLLLRRSKVSRTMPIIKVAGLFYSKQ